jgi:hypothetical protein
MIINRYMKLKILCRCSLFFLPGRAKDLSAPLYIVYANSFAFCSNSTSFLTFKTFVHVFETPYIWIRIGI